MDKKILRRIAVLRKRNFAIIRRQKKETEQLRRKHAKDFRDLNRECEAIWGNALDHEKSDKNVDLERLAHLLDFVPPGRRPKLQ